MKIESNTTVKEIQEKNLASSTSTENQLETVILNRIMGLQELISSEKGENISLEELVEFLDNVINYNEFQIWLSDITEKKLSKEERLKLFLSRTSDNDILRLYGTEKNYNQNNLANITKMIDESSPEFYGMQVNEMGSGIEPIITKESRKALVKSLLDFNRDCKVSNRKWNL